MATQNKRYTWTKNFPNGDRYNGEATGENIRDGHGEFFCAATGATYVGAWSKDKPHGKGTYTLPGDAGYTYEGDFVNGERSGKGRCAFTNGRNYDGDWLADRMHGRGQLRGAPGVDRYTDYTGPFVKGERSGVEGVCHYADGGRYKGGWQHDTRHGHGEWQLGESALLATPLTSSSHLMHRGSLAGLTPSAEPPPAFYVGAFANDAPSGLGEFRYADGATYKGACDGLWRHGEGEHRLGNGDVFVGHFVRDRRHGRGVLRASTGVYDADWRDGLLDGHLLFTASSGAVDGLERYEGPCVGGEMTGSDAVAHFRDGSSYRGEVLCGRPSGRGVLEKRPVTLPGVGEALLCYEGVFVSGAPSGTGSGTLAPTAGGKSAAGTAATAPTAPPPPQPSGSRGWVPSYSLAGAYSGEWAGGLPNGSGEWQWKNGRTYRGGVRAGLPAGNGLLIDADVRYEGALVAGAPHGRGVARWTNGESYDGDWRDGLCDGDGTLVVPGADGYTYTGGWQRGRREGRGVECAAGRFRYDGGFKDGRRNGRGTLHTERDATVYEGEFADGAITGRGAMTQGDGTVMEGTFLNGKPHGEVQTRLATRGIFTGKYEKGSVVGSGRMVYPNGDKYEGEFTDSGEAEPLRHGRGVYTFAEGNVLECTWRRNVLNGEGVYITATGERKPRSYTNGVLDAGTTGRDHCVFTPGNEFPNTLSEDALRDRQRRQPFVSVRRVAPGKPTVSTRSPRASLDKGQGNPQSPSPRAPLTAQSVPKLSSARDTPVAALAAATPNDGGQSERRRSLNTALQPPTVATPARCSAEQLRHLKRTVLADRKVSERRGSSLVERFESGIRGLLTPPKVGESSATKEAVLPLKRDELMQKASSIRNSKEDEIHLLTEELRQLNERIWQLGFLISSPAKKGEKSEQGAGKEAENDEAKRLDALIDERRDVTEKLHCLITNS